MRTGDKPQRKAKVIRSFSINEEALERLHVAANRRKISVNALLMEIIDYYLIMGIRSEDIGLIHLTIPTFKRFLKNFNMNDEFYEEVERSTPSAWEEWVEVRGLKRDLPSFIKMVRYYEPIGYAKVSVSESPVGGYRVVLMHELGPSWSKYLAIRLRGGYEYMTGKTLPDDAITLLSNGLSMRIKP